MRLPKIYKTKPDDTITKTTLKVNKIDHIDYYPDVDLDDEKSTEHYIKTIKSVMRSSYEYKNLVSFLKNQLDLNRCWFMPKIKKYRSTEHLKIEMHHTGLVAEDIIRVVLRKRYGNGEDYDVLSVVHEIMEQHYRGNISLTALSTTAHSLIHEDDSNLFIPIQLCDFGDIRKFVELYSEWVPKELKTKFDTYCLMSDAITPDNLAEYMPDVLKRSYLYYDVEGVAIPKIDEVLAIIDMDSLKD